MVKKTLKPIIATITILTILGCSSNQPQPKKVTTGNTKNKKIKEIEKFVKNNKTSKTSTKKIAVYTDKPINIKEVNKILLKTSPLYAKKYKKEALKENMRLTPNTPLYRPPLFAQMIVYPYVSDDGIYHDTQLVWIKVKDGEFVLNQKNHNTTQKVFSIK